MNKSPFNYQATPVLARNYSDTFNAEEYECKDSIELESYARNLHNYLKTLLPQEPFPAFLFEKLEKRLDGITSILQRRSAASGALSKEKAEERLQVLGQRIVYPDAVVSLPPTTPRGMLDLSSHPPKKRKTEAPGVRDVRKEVNALRALKRSYSTLVVDEEEED